MVKENDRTPFVGEKAPKLTLPSTAGDIEIGGKKDIGTVLYFYPKDDTSGCTKEAIEFTQHLKEFSDLGFQIVGVSPDPIKKHEKFIAKHSLEVLLASDEELEASNAYGVWVEKSMYGKKYMGIERSTFLIDSDGGVVKVWRKVRVAGHVEAVLDATKQAQK